MQIRSSDQDSILKKIELFIELIKDEIPRKSHRSLREKFVLDGQCFAFTFCREYMRVTGNLEWWKDFIYTIVTSSINITSLNEAAIIFKNKYNKDITFKKIFEMAISYFIYNQAEPLQCGIFSNSPKFCQYYFLLPENPHIFLLSNNNKDVRIKNNYRIGGYFSLNSLLYVLNDRETIESIRKNICLLQTFGHTSSIGIEISTHENDKWVLYDPNGEIEGEAFPGVTDSAQEIIVNSIFNLANSIINKYGNCIALELVAINDEHKPFSNYYKLLQHQPEELIKDEGIYIISNKATALLKPLLDSLCNNQKLDMIQPRINELSLTRGNTMLIEATLNGETNIVKLLCAYGAKINISDSKGFIPLIIGASRGHIETMKTILSITNSLWNVFDIIPTLTNAVAAASGAGHLDIIKLFNCYGNDIFLQIASSYNSFRKTPIMNAAETGHHEIVKFFCEILNFTHDWQLALLLAAKEGHSGVIEILYRYKVNLDFTLNDKPHLFHGYNALMIASRFGHTNVIETLIDNGIEFDYKLSFSKERYFNLLKEQNPNLQLADNLFFLDLLKTNHINLTALDMAVIFNQVEVVKILLVYTTTTNLDLERMLKISSHMNHVQLIPLLNQQILNSSPSRNLNTLFSGQIGSKRLPPPVNNRVFEKKMKIHNTNN